MYQLPQLQDPCAPGALLADGEQNFISAFHAVIPRYQKMFLRPIPTKKLAVLPEKPKRNCTEVENKTWVFIVYFDIRLV